MAYNPNNPNGSATSANSAPVVIASDQAALPLPTGASTSALQTTGNTSLATIATNSGTQATSALQTTGNTSLATIATQTSHLPTALGAATSANSLPVVIASDQAGFTVGTAPLAVYGTPTSISMAALNASVVYNVDPGANLYLTLTNGPAATTAWSGTVTFQYSLNGGTTWSTLTVYPAGGPAAGGGVTTATANGFWFVDAPSATGLTASYVQIRATFTAYTSGTAYFLVSAQSQANAVILLPWTYAVTTGTTVIGPLDVSGISEIDLHMTAITTAVYTWQGTNDPTLTTWNPIDVQDTGAQATGAATIAAVPTGAWRMVPSGFKWARLQCTTTGTVWTVQGVSAKLGQVNVLGGYGNAVAISNTPAVTISSGTVTTVSTVSSITAGTITTVGSVTAVAAINSVATTNGLTLGTQITPTTPAALSVKASAGRLHFLQLGNPNTTAVYLKIYNAASVTLGTTSAAMNFYIPASTSLSIPINPVGLYFSAGIFMAVTLNASLTDNTAITTGCELNYSFI
jgi:hypothetical protein